MRRFARYTVFCLLVVLAFMPATALAQDSPSCKEQDSTEICITAFSISKSVVQQGKDVTGVLRIENVGNSTGEVVVVVAITQPDGPPKYHQIRRIRLASGQSKEIPLGFTTEDSTLGERQLGVLLLDSDGDHLYDATGYSQATVVKENPLTLGEVAEFIKTSRAALWIVISVVLPVGGYLLGSRRSSRW